MADSGFTIHLTGSGEAAVKKYFSFNFSVTLEWGVMAESMHLLN